MFLSSFLFNWRSGGVSGDSGNDLILLIDSSLDDFITLKTREKLRATRNRGAIGNISVSLVSVQKFAI